nr:T9SS type A sorting domain-containing protein [Ignavibacteria bacterium]
EGSVYGFQTSPVNVNLNSIFFYLDDNTGYCAGNSGTILKTTNGGGAIITAIPEVSQNVPGGFTLEQNYPNPFNPTTKIKFSVPQNGGYINITVFDITGTKIQQLYGGVLSAGKYETEFDADNRAAGVYFLRLQTGTTSLTRKMLLVK